MIPADIDLSLDDRFLVSCWGTGEMRQYDVTDPMDPGSSPALFHIGGIAPRKTDHPGGKAYRTAGRR